MAWVKGTPLVADVAELAELTSQQDLLNLELGGEITIVNVLTSASDVVFVQVKSEQADPAKITNSDDYKHAVAYHALAKFVQLGYVPVPEGLTAPETPFDWSDPYLAKVKAELSEGDESRTVREAIPRVGNVHRRSLLNPGLLDRDEFFDDLARRR